MIKIGILGSDSSHALAFTKLCNIPDKTTGEYSFPDVRITMIYGHDKTQTKNVAMDGQIETIATTPDELLGNVNAVMILFRDGNLHTSYALPFIKASIPVWIDKPITVDIKDCEKLIMEAEKYNCLITGGSTCKYNQDVLQLAEIANNGTLGNVVSGYINFPGDINSPYNGLHFYGPHMAEMLFTVFGYHVKSITTTLHNSEIICVANYEKISVVLNFNNTIADNFCLIHGDKKSYAGIINIDESTYKQGFKKFVEMLNSGKRPLSLDKLVAPTVLLTAILESLSTGSEIFLDKYTK
jgi:predicted dehydrogenase